jgi:NADH-quinone oxidoreductase subunit E
VAGIAAVVATTKAKSTAKPKAKAVTKTKTKAPVKSVAKSKDARPPKIKKPAKPDDLKLISGIGPKLEGVLHGLGIYKFEQIAKWKKAERDWVDGYLNFKGRIDRDEWVAQAKKLAKK